MTDAEEESPTARPIEEKPPPAPAPVIKQYSKLMRQLAASYRRRHARPTKHVKSLHDELWKLAPRMSQALDTVAAWSAPEDLRQASATRLRALQAALSALADILLNVPTMTAPILNLVENTGPPDMLARARSVFVTARTAQLEVTQRRHRA